MLLEVFHWDPGTLAKADIDYVFPLVAYYPYWKEQQKKKDLENEVFADQADWL